MKFLHLSDTHLGYQQYQLKERVKDYLDVFNQAIDVAIENDVDFIIHTGDFFHNSKPSNETIVDAINLIKRLNMNNIPIYTIPGNHDRGSGVRDTSPLEILSHFGLKVLNKDVEEFNGINIFGVKYIPRYNLKSIDIKNVLEDLFNMAENKNNFSIIMLHFEFEPFFLNGLKLEDIPDSFNYIGIGHLHQRQEPIKDPFGRWIVYPGSTEYTAFNENTYVEKGCYIVNLSTDKSVNIEFKPLSTRKFLSIDQKIENDEDFEILLNKIKDEAEKIDDNVKKPVLFLKVGTNRIISNKEIIQFLEKNDLTSKFLHIETRVFKKDEISFDNFININSDNFHIDIENLIDDKELASKLKKLFDEVKNFEDLEEMKKYIEEHHEYFEL